MGDPSPHETSCTLARPASAATLHRLGKREHRAVHLERVRAAARGLRGGGCIRAEQTRTFFEGKTLAP